MQQLGSSEHGKEILRKKFILCIPSYSVFVLKGLIDRQQFITGVQRQIPPDELEELLRFDIIPAQLLDEANMLPSLQSSSTNLRNPNDYGINELVSDDQLRQIANQASRKNWQKLALTLGFLEYDVEAYKTKNNNDSAAAVCREFSY